MPCFTDKTNLNSVKNLVANRHLYLDFENDERETVNGAFDFVSGLVFKDNSNNSEVAHQISDNKAKLKDNRLMGNFVSKNVIAETTKKVRHFVSFKRT